MEEKTKIENIVRVGEDHEIKIPLRVWKDIDAAPGDYVQCINETGADEGHGDYEYIKIIKHPTSILNMPTKEYFELQEKIDNGEIPFKTVDEAVIFASKKLLNKTVGK